MSAKQILAVGVLVVARVSATDSAPGDRGRMRPMTAQSLPASTAKELGALASATAWINSGPLSAAALRGKVDPTERRPRCPWVADHQAYGRDPAQNCTTPIRRRHLAWSRS